MKQEAEQTYHLDVHWYKDASELQHDAVNSFKSGLALTLGAAALYESMSSPIIESSSRAAIAVGVAVMFLSGILETRAVLKRHQARQ